jgi:two-component system phosphate regulon sensor histidine kinase PhoR
MNNGHLRRLIIFGSIVLAGLMTVQIYWFKQAFDVSEKQLDHRVQIAIMRVADSVSTGAKVSKLSRNFFFVNSETNFDNNVIDSLVRTEFERIDPSLDYELGVYKAEDDKIGQTNRGGDRNSESRAFNT